MTDAISRSNAWIFTCESWLDQGTHIVLPVNPNEIEFQMPLRMTNESYRSTKLTYVWRERGFKTIFDCPIINFNIPSGNILPSFSEGYIRDASLARAGENTADENVREAYLGKVPPYRKWKNHRTGVYANVTNNGKQTTDVGSKGSNTPDLYRPDIPIGIQNAYAFYALAEERHIRVLPNGVRTDNRIMAVISTLVFPRLVLYGFFSEQGISTEESAENPGEFNLTFSLVVTDTFPKLRYNQWAELNDFYLNGITTDETTQEFIKGHADRFSNQMLQDSVMQHPERLTFNN